MLASPATLAASVLLLCNCATPSTTVPLLSASGIPVTLTTHESVPLEVVTRATGVPDPLPVEGTSVAYSDVETALGHAVSSGAAPWADAHRDRRPDGWQLLVELVRAEAHYRAGRMTVDLGVRATLRGRRDNKYLAQTNVHCRQAAVVPPSDAGPVVYSCMTQLSRELAGWLGLVQP